MFHGSMVNVTDSMGDHELGRFCVSGGRGHIQEGEREISGGWKQDKIFW